MNNTYSIRTNSGTAGFVISGLLSTSLLLSAGSACSHEVLNELTPFRAMEASFTRSSANTFRFTEFESSAEGEKDIHPSIVNFYKSMVGRQEALGPEFERVLVDNLWDLYSQS